MNDIDFGTFKRDPLASKVAERIIDLIKIQQLQPGDRLPSEQELAEMMVVSKPIIRSALRTLSIMNVVEIRKKEGVFITSLEPEQLVINLNLKLPLTISTFQDLLRVRMVVEPALAEAATRNVKNVHVRMLERCLELSKASINDPQTFLETDLELHQIICKLARSPILCAFMNSLVNLGIQSRRRTTEIFEMRKSSILDHDAIIKALESRDPNAASRAMCEHLMHVEESLNWIAKSGDINTTG